MTHLTHQQAWEWVERIAPGDSVYLVGAGGCGMSGLGHMFLDLGCRVSGSDLASSIEVSQLRERGAVIHVGHAAEHLLSANPSLVVYSSAIRRDNPELAAAEAAGLPIAKRGLLLAALARRQRGICVAGMHGKSTTSGWLAWCLNELRAQASHAVGALMPQLGRHARIASGTSGAPQPWFALECDESDGTLAAYHPEIALILNVDAEHLDYYATFEAILLAFRTFADSARGPVIFCADDAPLSHCLASHPRAVSFGFHARADYRIVLQSTEQPASGSNGTAFEVLHKGVSLGMFTSGLLGRQNVSNAGAVVACLHQIGFSAPDIARVLPGFHGVARRQQELFRNDSVRVYEDYGHHPAEIEATLEAFKTLRPTRLLVAFQPHRFTRTQLLGPRFATSFRAADRLWVTSIYSAGEPVIPGVDGRSLARIIAATGQPVEYADTLQELNAQVLKEVKPGDVVLYMGAGDIGCAAHALAATLRTGCPRGQQQWQSELIGRLSSAAVVKPGEPLARHTTFRVGGPADLYVEPASENDLAELLRFATERRIPFTLVGRGSNLLIRDGGMRGIVACLALPAFNGLEVEGQRLRCGAGVKLKAIAHEARRKGLAGLEFLEGIPGSLGGALRMNAGAMGGAIFECVETVRLMDRTGAVRDCPASEMRAVYRDCPALRDHIALGAVLLARPEAPEVVAHRMDEYSRKRWRSQPAAPSAGCVFKNPPGTSAGRLIDELGLKGARVGAAAVSDVHANFIVNEGGATARDVLDLIELVRTRVLAERGITLETEVQILGEDLRGLE